MRFLPAVAQTLMLSLMLSLSAQGHVQAQVVAECDWIASAANLAEPWAENTRTYANGAIRVALLDTGGEPVCCAAHLLVLHPSAPDEPTYRQCTRVSATSEGLGFYDLSIARIAASYDPTRGLLLSVPVFHWHQGMDQGAAPIEERMEVRINQATGIVSIE